MNHDKLKCKRDYNSKYLVECISNGLYDEDKQTVSWTDFRESERHKLTKDTFPYDEYAYKFLNPKFETIVFSIHDTEGEFIWEKGCAVPIQAIKYAISMIKKVKGKTIKLSMHRSIVAKYSSYDIGEIRAKLKEYELDSYCLEDKITRREDITNTLIAYRNFCKSTEVDKLECPITVDLVDYIVKLVHFPEKLDEVITAISMQIENTYD